MIEVDLQERPALLAVLAHPDDESFGMGGTLALYAKRGARVDLICATRGEAGEVDEDHLQGYENIAQRREAELLCAAAKLGLNEVIFMGYRDSGMPGSPDNDNPASLFQAPMTEVVERIASDIRRLRPDVLITFDPIGGYRHPDHIKIHQATVRAFDLAADPLYKEENGLPPHRASKFYFQTVPHGLLKWIVRLMPLIGKDPSRFGRNQDINLRSIAEVDFPVHARIDYRVVAELRDEASACHSSQGGASLTGGFFGKLRRWLAANETFMRAYPPPENGHIERDLLEGLPYKEKAISR